MPPDDGCMTELDRVHDQIAELEVLLAMAQLAKAEWHAAKEAVRAECLETAIPNLPNLHQKDEFDFPIEPMDHAVAECIETHPDVFEAWDLFEQIALELEIELEVAHALLDEYKACSHALI
ncbi:hypothetical protein ACJJID_09135 [Microbulbifer sp. CnH-101-G]|uniref:hypothetical protein n=1 Tax=Microbulbifer sp. CnH-101-G TaxID=3243393 RepID=UPI00403A302B